MHGIVDNVYQKHKNIIGFIINNIDDFTPSNYIGDSIDLIITGINLDEKKLIDKIENTKDNKLLQYFIFYRDYIKFVRSRISGRNDYEIINMISKFYYNNLNKSRCDINKHLIRKYQKIKDSLDTRSNCVIVVLMENMLYKLNNKLSSL